MRKLFFLLFDFVNESNLSFIELYVNGIINSRLLLVNIWDLYLGLRIVVHERDAVELKVRAGGDI